MSGRPRVARIALLVGVGGFCAVVAALVATQGVVLSPPGPCMASTWAPLRGLPWLAAGALPWLVHVVAVAVARRRRARSLTLGEGPYRQSVVQEATRIDTPRSHALVRSVLVVLALVAAVSASRRWSCPYALPARCERRTARIVMIGVGQVDPGLVDGLATHFRDCYGLPVEVAPAIESPLPHTEGIWFNDERQQWTAESLLSTLPGCNVGDPVCQSDVLVIGITSADMYTTQETWRYAFTIRDPAHRRAIISTHRMGTFRGTVAENARKIVAKTIALEYCGMPQVADPRRVRHNAIMGPDDLDGIDEAMW